MNISSAEKQVNKLLSYLEEISNGSTSMYSKSKVRLQNIASTCNQIVSIISNILQDEVLSQDVSDVESLEVYQAISNMQHSIDQLSHFIQVQNSQVSETVDFSEIQNQSVETVDISSLCDILGAGPDSYGAVEDTEFTSSTLSATGIQPEDCSFAIKQYSYTFRSIVVSTKSINNPIIHEVVNLLDTWFTSRFLDHKAKFKYDIRNISRWVVNFVILYGYHLEQGTVEYITSKFNTWCESLSSSVPYAVPYEVYVLAQDSKQQAEMLNLTSLVLWDILLDLGWRCICEDNHEIYPNETAMQQLVAAHAPQLLKFYRDYKQDKSILQLCNLV